MITLSELRDGALVTQAVEAPRFSKSFDVIVCGLGTAGAPAALYCAENGLSVLGVEAITSVGGTHTAGGVQHHYFGFPGGRHTAFDQAVRDHALRYTATQSESRKFLLEQAMLQQQVDIQYEATVCGVYLDGNCVIGLRILTENGILDYGAKLVMDCTAEAHIAVMAGCQTECGRKTDGLMQPYSMVSLVSANGKYRHTNIDYGRVNQYDPVAFSKAILFSRSYAMAEGHSQTTLIAQKPMIGLREGRRILPEEAVTIQDLFSDTQTTTPMFYAYADLDKHGWDIAFDGEFLGDWAIGANLGAYNVTVAVPYGSILPRGLEGILVPCRALGVDRDLSSCVRMIPDMKKAAECAAEWATLAINQKISLREVPYSQLKEKLEKSGCLNHPYQCDYRIDGQKDWDGTPLVSADVHWITDPHQLEAGLQTEKPGIAIWSAKRMGKCALPALRALLESQNENTRKHAAFALAALGEADGVALLRQMATDRDGLMLKDCRKNNSLRGCMAIYWLGRLADREITSELLRLISDPEEVRKDVYHDLTVKTTRYDIADFEGAYFQFMTQAVMALIRIGDSHADLRPEIANRFSDVFSGDDFYHRITKRPRKSSEGDQVLGMQRLALATAEKWNP